MENTKKLNRELREMVRYERENIGMMGHYESKQIMDWGQKFYDMISKDRFIAEMVYRQALMDRGIRLSDKATAVVVLCFIVRAAIDVIQRTEIEFADKLTKELGNELTFSEDDNDFVRIKKLVRDVLDCFCCDFPIENIHAQNSLKIFNNFIHRITYDDDKIIVEQEN